MGECWHEDFDADVNGRATCIQCGHTWRLTSEDIARERLMVAAYEAAMRREEWRRWSDDWLRKIAFWRRWRREEPINDDIPF